MSSTKTQFASKLGVIAATLGSAVGLGTVWRFPNEVQDNGGSVFLIVYLLCVLLMGIPVMLAEFALGRGSGSDAVGSFRKLSPAKRWWIVGAVAVVASYLILSFYIVVSGWTLEYLWMSITGELYTGIDNANRFSSVMEQSLQSGWRPLFWTALMIILNLVILLQGVQKGIEKMSNLLMPLLFIILIVFCCISLSLPGSKEGVEFFLKPDFSKLDGNVLINAVGQAFFSLSLGMGILVTYSSYYPASTRLGRTSFTVSGLVFVVAILMGLTIFPAVKAFGITGSTEGATLVFATLPEIFMQMPFTQLWSILFFFLLVFGSDTFAYFFGIAFGKNNKGIIKVSPNKSVAGFIGGLLVPALFGLLSAYIFPEIFTYSLFEGFLLGGITAALAATGDLIESSFKRCAEVKDSGNIIPGRGGVLDSVDSVVMAAPVYVAILTVFLGI